MNDLISRQAAIEKISETIWDTAVANDVKTTLKELPSAQQERIIYGNMSDEEFEKWLYGHGICNPNIRESIPCDVIPLLIDNAISELPSAQPEIIRCKDCRYYRWESDMCDYPYATAQNVVHEDDFCSRAERKEHETD